METVFQADAVPRLQLRPALDLLCRRLVGTGAKHRAAEKTFSLM